MVLHIACIPWAAPVTDPSIGDCSVHFLTSVLARSHLYQLVRSNSIRLCFLFHRPLLLFLLTSRFSFSLCSSQIHIFFMWPQRYLWKKSYFCMRRYCHIGFFFCNNQLFEFSKPKVQAPRFFICSIIEILFVQCYKT